MKNYLAIFGIKNYTNNIGSISLAGLQYLSMAWLFPGMMIGLVFSVQPILRFWFIPQMVILINSLAAIIIVFSAFRKIIFLFFLIIFILAAKILSYNIVSAGVLYALAVNLIYGIAISAILFKRPDLFYKQLMTISVLNLIFMFLQVLGVGSWTQFLTTHGYVSDVQQWSLFAEANDFGFDNVQARPAGILHSNIVVSGIVMLAAAQHFSRERGGSIVGTIILCTSCVLAMSKVAFIGFFLVLVTVIIMGNSRQWTSAVWGILVLVCSLFLYKIFFPGLFEQNTSFGTILYSFELRINDILQILPEGYGVHSALEGYINPNHTAYWSDGGRVSGITVVLKHWKLYMILLFVVVIPLYFKGVKRLKFNFHRLYLCSVTTLIVAASYPFAFPIWVSHIYGAILGGACLSFFILLRPFSMDFSHKSGHG